MSIYLIHLYLSISIYPRPSTYLSIYPSTSLSLRLSVCLPIKIYLHVQPHLYTLSILIDLCTYLCIYLHTYLIHPYIYLPNLFIHIYLLFFFSIRIYLSMYLSIYLPLPPFQMNMCIYIYVCMYLPLYLSISRPIHLSIHVYTCIYSFGNPTPLDLPPVISCVKNVVSYGFAYNRVLRCVQGGLQSRIAEKSSKEKTHTKIGKEQKTKKNNKTKTMGLVRKFWVFWFRNVSFAVFLSHTVFSMEKMVFKPKTQKHMEHVGFSTKNKTTHGTCCFLNQKHQKHMEHVGFSTQNHQKLKTLVLQPKTIKT